MSGRILGYNAKVFEAVLDVTGQTSLALDTRLMSRVSFEVVSTMTSTAKTAAAGIVAVGTLGGVTYTAVALSSGLNSAGNLISVAYTAGGTAGAEVVTVVGNAISVQIQSGVSTITQVRTAVNASVAAAALVTATGTSATTVATTAATLIPAMATPTTGVDSKFSVANNLITIASHGFFTGLTIQVTKSGAAFPGGISGTTDYFVFVVNANTIALYDTLAHALAAANNGPGAVANSTGVIDITSDGTAGSTMTLTPEALTGAVWKIQQSNDYDPTLETGNWVDIASATGNITSSTAVFYNNAAISAAFHRVYLTISTGQVKLAITANANST